LSYVWRIIVSGPSSLLLDALLCKICARIFAQKSEPPLPSNVCFDAGAPDLHIRPMDGLVA
jgi:hypothetical protein